MKTRALPYVFAMATLLGTSASALGQPRAGNFVAHLSGDEEVPSVETRAQGQAVFRLRMNGAELNHRVVVANIETVFAAHIHCAPVGINGPVGLTLFSGGPVTLNGTLTQGPLIGPDAGNGCGWNTLNDVVEDMRMGDTYVNVHTTQNPPGEIRGQISAPGRN